jgi:tetratricopeptide (TPR) repeat protein
MLLALRLRRFAICSSVAILLHGLGSVLVAQTPDTRSRLSEEGARALSEHRYADAARAYEQLRDLSPGAAEVQASLGFIYFQQGRFDLAVASLRQALKLKPSLPNASVLLAMSLSELGQFDEALPGLERGFKQAADTVLRRAAGLQLQRAYTGLGRHAEAVNVALQLARLYPKDPEILYQASRLHANFAYVTLLTLAEVAPDSLWVHLAAGEANESQELCDAAVREYRAALAIDHKRPGIHFRLGRVLLARAEQGTNGPDSEAEALNEFAQELRDDPTNANAAYEIAEIHRKAGDLGSARTFFENALQHYPDFEEALVGLGRSLVALQEPKLAITYLTKAIALNSKSEIAYYQLAQAHRALGDTAAQEKALAVFERLRSASERASAPATRSRPEVTKQKLDPKSSGKSFLEP